MGLYFQYCSVLKAAFYWFKFWIKIQQKLELLDGNLRGILHRHLGAVPLCHFSPVVTVMLPNPVHLHPSCNKIVIKSYQWCFPRQKQSGIIIRNENWGCIRLHLYHLPSNRGTRTRRWAGYKHLICCKCAQVMCLPFNKEVTWWLPAQSYPQLRFWKLLLPLCAETSDRGEKNLVIKVCCESRKDNPMKLQFRNIIHNGLFRRVLIAQSICPHPRAAEATSNAEHSTHLAQARSAGPLKRFPFNYSSPHISFIV